MPIAIDLTEMAAKLAGKPKYKIFVAAVARYQSACSIQIDLQAAVRALNSLESIQGDDDARRDFGAALMSSAILAYCRAVVSDQNGRHKVDATRDFTKLQKAKHKAIAELRNTVIAHYDRPRGVHAQAWQKERVVYKEFEDGRSSMTFVFERANYLAGAILDLRELTLAAEARVGQVVEERRRVLVEQSSALAEEREFFQAAAESHFSPEAFFDSADVAAAFFGQSHNARTIYEQHRVPATSKRAE